MAVVFFIFYLFTMNIHLTINADEEDNLLFNASKFSDLLNFSTNLLPFPFIVDNS